MHSAEGEVSRLLTESELDSLEREIERWLDLSLKENPLLASFERDPDWGISMVYKSFRGGKRHIHSALHA